MSKEKENIYFYDTSILPPTENISSRCERDYLQRELKKRFPDMDLHIESVVINKSGTYKKRIKKINNLPPYCEVKIHHCTGKHTEHIIIWSPFSWNGRFAGTAGGGTETGGEFYLTIPNNTVRGWTVPYAIVNGFTAGTTDAGNSRKSEDWAILANGRGPNWEAIENWRSRSTHHMTILGKAVAEILHQRPVEYSYMNGGSGGGRQSLVEAQDWPEDYDGIWASCPAINWTKFVLEGLWFSAVMNTYKHTLTAEKIKFFTQAVHDSVGGSDVYYTLSETQNFDPKTLVGHKTKHSIITLDDAKVMDELWKGAHRMNGEQLWYSFRPGTVFWNVGIPVGAFYYSLIKKQVKPFCLSESYARWITQNPKEDFTNITIAQFEKIFDKSVALFKKVTADQADLSKFASRGGKLMIDHGLADPLIPVDGTIDYYRRMCEKHGGKENVDKFCRLYITPGDGHGNCWNFGPGITESDGMKALIDWVEKGIAPNAIRTVRVKKSNGKSISEKMQKPY